MLNTSLAELMERWDEIEAPCSKDGNYFRAWNHLTEDGDVKLVFNCPSHGEFRRSLNSMIAFRKLCSKVSKSYARGEYSSTEKRIKSILEGIGYREAKTEVLEPGIWQHNYQVMCRVNGTWRRYRIDFYFDGKKGIEGDGTVWHKLWGVPRKDLVRDRALKKQYGIDILRLKSYMRDDEMELVIKNFLEVGVCEDCHRTLPWGFRLCGPCKTKREDDMILKGLNFCLQGVRSG